MWSSLAVSRILLRLLLQHLVADHGRVWRGNDETVERRWGPHIAAKGVYRDGVRSSRGHFVKAMGLRWISLMPLVSLPWTRWVWALPFLTVRAPSVRYHEARGCRHKTLTTWARQMLHVVRRWRPDRDLMVVGDRSYAALPLLAACQALTPAVTFLTRLRLDAALYAPAPPPTPGPWGRPRLKGHRLPSLRTILTDLATRWTSLTLTWPDGTVRTLVYASGTAVGYHPGHPPVPLRWRLLRDPVGRQAPQALLSTDPTLAPPTLLSGYLRRGSVEVTFQEVRAHRGMQTQRQGSDKTILRTTPALLGLFRWLVRAAHVLRDGRAVPCRRSAGYRKPDPTFADVLACVRRALWQGTALFALSPFRADKNKSPPPARARFMDLLGYTD